MKRTILSLITICCTSLALQAQMPQSYTLKSCLEYGLQNNYSLRIPRNEEQVSKNNATLGTPATCRHLTCQQVIKELLITLTVKCVPPENTSKRMVYSTRP